MTRSISRRSWPALLLATLLVAGGGFARAGVGAQGDDEDPSPAVSAVPESSPASSFEPVPAPTPYPGFDPSTVTLRTDVFSTGFTAPVYITDDGVPGKKCLYVVEQGGKVYVVDPRGGGKRPTPFLDLSKLVATGPEQGLHSIAFHPQFARNGRLFVHYDDRKTNAAVIAESKGVACGRAGPVKRLLTVSQEFPNNNAGWIGFSPKDGKLYIPLGDGGGRWPGDPRGNGQSKSTLLSKVLRIDVDDPASKRYAIPLDNPYVKRTKDGKIKPTGGFARETWAWGLRDPRRSSFDRLTGDLWIGDVGQDRHEEIDLIPFDSVKRGRAPNFGWSHVEGADSCHPNVPDCDPSLYQAPVYTYDKVAPHRAVTGGYVYRGSAIPALRGVYLFSDYASGFVWGLDAEAVDAGQEVPAHQLLDAPQGFVSFGEDDNGELYLVALEGSIYRLGAEKR